MFQNDAEINALYSWTGGGSSTGSADSQAVLRKLSEPRLDHDAGRTGGHAGEWAPFKFLNDYNESQWKEFSLQFFIFSQENLISCAFCKKDPKSKSLRNSSEVTQPWASRDDLEMVQVAPVRAVAFKIGHFRSSIPRGSC